MHPSLNNGNLYGTVPIEHLVCLCEKSGVTETLSYCIITYNWINCVDLKMVCFLPVQQHGYIKYLLLVHARQQSLTEKLWVKRNWPIRPDFKLGDLNILHESLVDKKKKKKKKITIPPLHMEPSLIMQFIKACSTEGDCFKCLILVFPGLSGVGGQSRWACLMVQMNISLGQCQNLKRMHIQHSKNHITNFLGKYTKN